MTEQDICALCGNPVKDDEFKTFHNGTIRHMVCQFGHLGFTFPAISTEPYHINEGKTS